MTSQTTAPAIIHKLVETFEQNLDSYRFSKNETELRREFLDKFFTALGWDVANEKGYDELGKEVIHEFSVDVAGQQKKADYAFRVGRGEKFDFLVEAKKPSVKVETSQEAAFQIRRYGWSAKLPINILTDFEHFAVYDCRTKPNINDKASMGRIMLIHYKDYVSRWNEIVEIFSPEAVRKGSFAKYAESMKGKKGTADVDDAFLQEIERWRELLAKNIALRNDDIDIAGLNYSVQMTIDRIVFLRICEERGIEPENQLLEITNTDNIYEELCELFKRADTKYNSGLFHFKQEKEIVSRPDDLTLSLGIDDKVLKDIVSNLYYPKSPYAFLYIPSDILGQVYERFLGKVIRLTAGHNAKVEEKPEVRKAGGVYYTPTYIVEYIVKNTVGKLVENKSPKDVASLKIVDPACGSGTFLLGAYQFLLDWHLNWYSENEPEKAEKNKAIVKIENGYRLTTAKKKEILLNNIHGVDIDAQAVEVTKLSLLLKVLENASGQLGLGIERVLPDLGNNIKCGNSLVGFDYFEGQLLPNEEEREIVNPFDWRNEFKEVFAKGGFDIVIGNPPYAYRNATEDNVRDYYLQNYQSAEGNFELYKFFIENNLRINREQGLSGIIVSATFLVQPSFQKLRKAILSKSKIIELSPLGPGVFEDATVDTTILLTEKASSIQNHKVAIKTPKPPVNLAITAPYFVSQDRFSQNNGMVFDYKLSDVSANITKKLFENFLNIESGFEFGVGINTGFIREELVSDKKEDTRYHPMVAGTGISRYGKVNTKGWIMYDKDYVKKRGKLGRTLPAENFLSSEKILVVRTRNLSLQKRVIATIDTDGGYNLNRLSNIIARTGYSLLGLLGILNSNLFNWLFSTRYYDYEIKPVYLRNSPLADCNNKKLISLVEQMIAFHKSLSTAKTPQEKERLERQIEVTDKAIDSLVYELYGLSDEEIKIVEGLAT
ncbi:MAG: N-6 DNA methylase [bacterium]|nr:N-6 DNA methylase [bacterium]